MSVKIYTHKEWGSAHEADGYVLSLPLGEVVIHTFAGASYKGKPFEEVTRYLRSIENFHVNTRGFLAIGYSFMIDEDGRIYEGRGWDRSGAHTQTRNRSAYGIGLIGHGDKSPATQAQVNSVRDLIAYGIEQGHIKQNFILSGHREYASKSCPGDLIYPLVESETFRPVVQSQPPVEPEPPKVDKGQKAMVNDMYLVHLGRFARPQELDYWTSQNLTLAKIEAHIEASEEAGRLSSQGVWVNRIASTLGKAFDYEAITQDLEDYRLSRMDVVAALKRQAILGSQGVPTRSLEETLDEIARRIAEDD